MTINEETQRKLSQDLPSGAVKTREQGGSKVEYIDGHFAMTRANEVFGHDGWSYSTRSVDEVYRGTKPGRDGENIVIVYEAIVCVTALGCTREDVGIGQCDSSLRNLGQAIEKGRKEAVTDAVKRALRSFGASFGLALYDKTKADVGASFAAQEAFDALDNAHDAAALDKARGVVKSLWESLSDAERETAAEKRDKAAKRIEKAQRSANATTAPTPTQEPPQRSANPLEGRDIEDERRRPQTAAETLSLCEHIREATAYVGGDNPTLGEHNRAVAEAQAMPSVPVWRTAALDTLDTLAEEVPSLAPFCNDVEKAALPSACGDAFCKHRTTLAALPADVRERAWKVLCERCVDAGQKNAKAWLKRYIAEADAKAAQTDAPAATEVTP